MMLRRQNATIIVQLASSYFTYVFEDRERGESLLLYLTVIILPVPGYRDILWEKVIDLDSGKAREAR